MKNLDMRMHERLISSFSAVYQGNNTIYSILLLVQVLDFALDRKTNGESGGSPGFTVGIEQ